MGSFIVTIAIFMIVRDWSHTATGSPEGIESVGIRFSESDYRAEENAGAVEVLLVRSGIVPDDIILTVRPLTLKDAARRGIEVPDEVSTTRDDYVNYGPVEVVFPAGDSITSVPVNIPIVNDDINEADERFVVVLESNSSLVDLSGRSIAFCEISNDDDIAIGFEKEDYVLTEGQETTISIGKNRETEQEFAVHLEVSPYLAVLGVDVNITSRLISLVFPPSEEKLVIPIKAINDSIPENVESLEMIAKYALLGTTLRTSCTEAGCHPITEIRIIDNDEVEVSLEKSSLTVREDAGAVTVCVLITRPTGPIDCTVNVYVTTQPGTAGEAEFIQTSRILALHRFRNRQCFDVMIIDDSVAEETKVFTAYLSGRNTDRLPQLLYGETSIVISILDDEIVAFENKTYSVSEEDGFVSVCVLRIGDVIEDLTATISTADGTATGSSDYVTKNTNIVFTSTSSHRVCVPIALVDDNIPEVPESFNVTLSTEGTIRDTATITITDGDVAADPEKGCSVELYVFTAVQEIAQAEVVASIQTVLPSIPITAPTSSPGNTSTGTPDKEETITVLYESVVKELGVVKSNATFNKFKEAVAEITEAHEEACSGPEELRPVAGDIPALAQKFSSLLTSYRNGEELRTIFGKMLCLNDLSSTSSRRKKRQGGIPCPCPPGGLASGMVSRICEFFKCLDEEFEMTHGRGFRALFGFQFLDFNCLAFVVDTTGSMGPEISATKELIKSFVSSEEDEPACYVLTPFNDHGNTPPILGTDYGPAAVYDTYGLDDLLRLKTDIEALRAHSGGPDCVEYGMSGLDVTFRAQYAGGGGDAMTRGSQAIVITDAGAKDDYRADEIIRRATIRGVCVHFFFGTPLPRCAYFGSYPRVADETDGTQVTSYDSFADLLGIITRFHDTYGTSRCGYTGMSRRRRQVEIDGYTPESRCHSFRVSELATVLKVHIKTTQSRATITKSDNTLVSVTIENGYNPPYKETYPREGTWSACTSNGVLSILVEQQIDFDATVSYVKKDDSTAVGIVATTKLPPACTEGQIAVFTSKHGSISSLHLNFLNEDLEVTQQVPLTFCGGAFIGNATFPLGSVTYQLEGEDTTRNPFTYRIKKKPTFQPGNLNYTLKAISGPQEVGFGNSTTLTFELNNLDYYHLLNISLTVEAHSGFINSISPTKVSVGAGESVQITVIVRAASSSLTQGSSYSITVADKSGCTELSASQTIKIKEVQAPPTSVCSCENGGTCYYIERRGMTFERCRCPSGYGGNKCQIVY